MAYLGVDLVRVKSTDIFSRFRRWMSRHDRGLVEGLARLEKVQECGGEKEWRPSFIVLVPPPSRKTLWRARTFLFRCLGTRTTLPRGEHAWLK